MKLTAQEIARYRPPEGRDHIVFDSELAGFGLRYRNGKRTWIYQYAFGSNKGRVNARMTLGEVEFTNVPVSINQAPMSESLLGMSLLRDTASMEIRDRKLFLRWR